jgi:hypothetical protein
MFCIEYFDLYFIHYTSYSILFSYHLMVVICTMSSDNHLKHHTICFYFADFGQGSVGSNGLIPLSVSSKLSDSSLEDLQNSLKVVSINQSRAILTPS